MGTKRRTKRGSAAEESAGERVGDEGESYFRVTTVHGFRYLEAGGSSGDRILWLLVILSGFAYAGYLIHANLKDWEENPVLTTITSTSTPVQEVQFPTVTVCPGPRAEPDRWGFAQEALDSLRFECRGQAESGFDCEGATGAIRERFAAVVSGTFALVVKNVETFYEGADLDTLSDLVAANAKRGDYFGTRGTEAKILDASAALAEKDVFAALGLRTDVRKALSPQLGKLNYYDSSEFFTGADGTFVEQLNPGVLNEVVWPAVEKAAQESGLNVTEGDGALDRCRNDTAGGRFSCAAELAGWHKLLLAANRAFDYNKFGGFGTYLSHFAYLVGSSFRHSSNWPGRDPQLGPLEEDYHGFLAQVYANVTGSSEEEDAVSLLDLPALLGVMRPDRDALQSAFIQYPWANQAVYSTERSKVCTRDDLKFYGQRWASYIYGGGREHPCRGVDEVSPCCGHWGSVLGKNLEAVTKMMAFAYPRGRSHRRPSVVEEVYSGYDYFANNYPQYEAEGLGGRRHIMAMIPSCSDPDSVSGAGAASQECDLFSATPSSDGVCHAYNARPVDDVFADSSFAFRFKSVFEVDEGDNGTAADNVRLALGDGDRFGLSFYLDANTRARPTYEVGVHPAFSRLSRKSSFTVSVGSAEGAFDTKRNLVEVKPGMHTVIKVLPSQTVASEELRSVPPERRGCRFPDEKLQGMELFREYSMAGCQFEHMLKHSRERCGCTPWNYPSPPSEPSDLCDHFGSLCFVEALDDAAEARKASLACQPDCEDVSFTYSESVTAIDPDEACNTGFVSRYMKQKQVESWYPLMFRGLEDQIESGDRWDTADMETDDAHLSALCRSALEHDLARVTVKLGSPVLTTSARTRKTTFAGQLATFGGTVGLFTGMSFLSAFEILFWIKRGLSKLMTRC